MIDAAAERAVLAGIFRFGGDSYLDVADIVSSSSFTIESNQAVYRCVDSILKDDPKGVVDVPSVISAAKKLGLDGFFQRSEEWLHLRALTNFPVQQANVRKMAGVVRKLEIAREFEQRLELAKKDLQEVTGYEPIDKIVSIPEGHLFDYQMSLAREDKGIIKMGDGAEEYLTYLMDNPREMVGIDTGFKRYNTIIGGGYRPNSMDILVARMKAGKSQWVDNVCVNIATQGIKTLNLDTEMDHETHLTRVSANLAGVTVHDIERGKCRINPDDKQKVLEASRKLRDMPYYYRCVRDEPFEETLSLVRRWVIKEVGLGADGKAKPCVIFYDYLKIMDQKTINKNMAEYQALGFLTTTIKNFAGRYAVAFPCCAQANRDGIDNEDSSIIAGSDRIGMFATSATLLKKKTPEELAQETGKQTKYTHKLVSLIPSRYGEGLDDGDYINIRADYRIGRLTEGPTASELSKGISQPKGIVINGDGGPNIIPGQC